MERSAFTTWLSRLGPVEGLEELHALYVRTFGDYPLSRMRLVRRLNEVGVTVASDGSILLPEDWR